MFGSWAATDLYVNGTHIRSFGNIGAGGLSYEEHQPYQQLPVPLNLEVNKEYVMAIHFVDYATYYPLPRHLKSDYWMFGAFSQNLASIVSITLPGYDSNSLRNGVHNDNNNIVVASVIGILCLLFWLLFYLHPREKNLLLIAITCTIIMTSTYFAYFLSIFYFSSLTRTVFASTLYFFGSLFVGIIPVLLSQLLLNKILLGFRIYFIFTILLGIVYFFSLLSYLSDPLLAWLDIIDLLLIIFILIQAWKKIYGAQWAIATGSFVTLASFTVFLFLLGKEPNIADTINKIAIISFPVSMMVYVSMRFNEILNDVRENARQVIQVTEEKRDLLASQNEMLEQQVTERTAELNQSLQNLKATQSQLIQQEKMASLGELTAGIAHEIQNPLNFVNNFSEVNKELLAEMKAEIDKGNYDEVKLIATDVEDNEEKILHHGKRADAIVKGMLQHSRVSTGQKEPTDINALCDEYLRLSYHGLRAKDKSFNVTLKTDFDDKVGKINVVPQDMGRVMLNLFNNAFYAVTERKKQVGAGYEPIVSVCTKKIDGKIEIHVRDNGVGIPQKVVDKIFQPFFTTRPTGQGTGLGLSLAYDIIKAHGGEIRVETKEGEGSEFVIQLSTA
jgi:signal transduction histidine kinase